MRAIDLNVLVYSRYTAVGFHECGRFDTVGGTCELTDPDNACSIPAGGIMPWP